jgi:hypothetical protein
MIIKEKLLICFSKRKVVFSLLLAYWLWGEMWLYLCIVGRYLFILKYLKLVVCEIGCLFSVNVKLDYLSRVLPPWIVSGLGLPDKKFQKADISTKRRTKKIIKIKTTSTYNKQYFFLNLCTVSVPKVHTYHLFIYLLYVRTLYIDLIAQKLNLCFLKVRVLTSSSQRKTIHYVN